MAYQLDHRSQGASAHASVPVWSTSASAVWSIEFEIEVFSLSSTITLGGATYAARVAQITTAGTVTCQNSSGGTVLTSAAGAVTVGVNTIKVERTSGGLWQLTVNGVSVSTSSTAACAPMTYLANRVQNSYTNTNIAIRRVVTSGGAYSTVWDGTNAPSTGTTWTSSDGQVATLNSFTGLENSWWGFYNSITTTGIPNNTLGAALNQPCQINLNNYFTGATSYSVLSGSLPTGLSIVGNQIVGTPTTAESRTLVIRASNAIEVLDSPTITFNTGLWYLQQSGSSGYLQTSVGLKFVSGDDWVFRFALQQASNAFFRVFGEPSTTQSRIFINPTELLLRLEFAAGGSCVDFTLPSGFSIATKRDFVLSKSGTSYTLEIDGAAPIIGVLFGSSRAWGSASNTFFRSSNTTMSDGALYYFEFEKNGVIQNSYDPNTSGGVGNLLIDRVNKNNAAQAGTWPADNSEWVFYSSLYVGEGTISFSAAAAAAVASAKVGNVTVSAIATTVEDIQGSKIGFAPLNSPISAGIAVSASKVGEANFSMPINAVLGIAAHKVGVAPLYIEAVADISLYAGNIYIGEGTFTVTATANVALKGEKVGQSQVQFVAAAALFCTAAKLSGSDLSASANATAQLQASKTTQSTTHLVAAASTSADGYKVGLGTVAALSSVTISLSGNNPAAAPAPVTFVFVRSSSRHIHNVRTSSRYNYNIKTSSGGARV